MNIEQALTAGVSLGGASAVVAQSAVTDGLDPTTGWAGGMVVAGVAVFVFLDRRRQRELAEANQQRRREDEKKDKRIEDLEAENRRLNDQIIDELRRRADGG